MTSSVIFTLMYIAASIKASGWRGSFLVAGLVETAMVVLSFHAAAASISLNSRMARSPKVSMRGG